jgi:hypothetical protein
MDVIKKPSTEAAPGTMSDSEQRFSSLFRVASKLSFKSPHGKGTKEVHELQTQEAKVEEPIAVYVIRCSEKNSS